jgi:hypothetical protein
MQHVVNEYAGDVGWFCQIIGLIQEQSGELLVQKRAMPEAV